MRQIMMAIAAMLSVTATGAKGRAPAPQKKAVGPVSIRPGKWSLAWGAGLPQLMTLDARGGYTWGKGPANVGSWVWREGSRVLLVTERSAGAGEWVTWWAALDKDGCGVTRSDTPWANGVSVRVRPGLPQQGGRVEVTD